MIKKGDKVRRISEGSSDSGIPIGTTCTVKEVIGCSIYLIEKDGGYDLNRFELINNLTQKPMSIVEKFTLLLKSEPEKSFRKAGITNGNDLLTDEGQKIFLTWILNKNKNEFKKEIVDDLLKELKEDK